MEVHLRLFQGTFLSLKSHVYIHMEKWSLNFELDCFFDNIHVYAMDCYFDKLQIILTLKNAKVY